MYKYIFKGSNFFILLFFVFIVTSGQEFPDVPGKYKNEMAVVLSKEKHITISYSQNNKLEIKSENRLEKLYLSDKANYYGDEYIYNTFFFQTENLEAYLFTPRKYLGYKKTEIENITTQNYFADWIFYDDASVNKIVFPNLKKGYKTLITYQQKVKDPHFLTSFYFASYIPIIKSELSVTFPNSMKINYVILNNTEQKVKFIEEKGRKNTTYRWIANHVDKYNVFYNDFPVSFYTPHLLVGIDSYKINDEEVAVLSDIDHLYEWYYTYISKINNDLSDGIKELVDSLTAESSSDIEKIREIYYWVQDNINYIAIEDGYAGYIPAEANDIFRNRYGDCKGMSSLLNTMLRLAGIESKYVWVGTRSIPYTHDDIPGPHLHNHMIVAVPKRDDYLILDPTGEYLPLGMPSSFIQGKEALISRDENNYDIYEIPVFPYDKSRYQDTVMLEVSEDDVIGNATVHLTGYYKYELSYEMVWNNESKHKEIVNQWLRKSNDKFIMDTFNILNLSDREKDLMVDYRFTINNYVNRFEGSLYINLNLDKLYNSFLLKEKDYPYHKKIDFKNINNLHVILKIPEGYFVESIPEDASYHADSFGFDIKYQQNDSTIILNRKIYLDALSISPDMFDQWNKMIKYLNESYFQSVALKKKKP